MLLFIFFRLTKQVFDKYIATFSGAVIMQNELSFVSEKPHNPMVNSGSILTNALLQSLMKPEMSLAEKFDYVNDYVKVFQWQFVTCSFKLCFERKNENFQMEKSDVKPKTKVAGHPQLSGGRSPFWTPFWIWKDLGLVSFWSRGLHFQGEFITQKL